MRRNAVGRREEQGRDWGIWDLGFSLALVTLTELGLPDFLPQIPKSQHPTHRPPRLAHLSPCHPLPPLIPNPKSQIPNPPPYFCIPAPNRIVLRVLLKSRDP